jgi:hypothetical protein
MPNSKVTFKKSIFSMIVDNQFGEGYKLYIYPKHGVRICGSTKVEINNTVRLIMAAFCNFCNMFLRCFAVHYILYLQSVCSICWQRYRNPSSNTMYVRIGGMTTILTHGHRSFMSLGSNLDPCTRDQWGCGISWFL